MMDEFMDKFVNLKQKQESASWLAFIMAATLISSSTKADFSKIPLD